MLNFFKKKSPLDRLRAKYEKLSKEAFDLSTVDRRKSDLKMSEAAEVLKEIEAIEG